jgi:hypothetical protein
MLYQMTMARQHNVSHINTASIYLHFDFSAKSIAHRPVVLFRHCYNGQIKRRYDSEDGQAQLNSFDLLYYIFVLSRLGI